MLNQFKFSSLHYEKWFFIKSFAVENIFETSRQKNNSEIEHKLKKTMEDLWHKHITYKN